MGITGNRTSHKKFKKQEHKRERRAVKSSLEKENFISPKKYGNEWDSPRDGKMWMNLLDSSNSKWMRK